MDPGGHFSTEEKNILPRGGSRNVLTPHVLCGRKTQNRTRGLGGDREIRTPSLRGIKIKKSSRWRRKQKRRHRDDFLILRELAGCSGGLGAEPPAKNLGFSASAAGVWGRSPQQINGGLAEPHPTVFGLNLDTLKAYRDGIFFPGILSTRSTYLDYQVHQILSF